MRAEIASLLRKARLPGVAESDRAGDWQQVCVRPAFRFRFDTAKLVTSESDRAINEHVGRRVFLRRRTLHMTQMNLANAIGVRFQQIQKYECGASRLSPVRLIALAQALDVDVSYFFAGLEERRRHSANG